MECSPNCCKSVNYGTNSYNTTMYISSYLWTCSSPCNILYTYTHEQRESYYIQQCFVERVMGCPACMRLPQISALLYLALPHNVLSINYILSHLTQVASGPHLVIILIVLRCETLAGSGHGSYFILLSRKLNAVSATPWVQLTEKS